MLFDVSKITKVNMASIDINFLEKINDLKDLVEDFDFEEPVGFVGKLTNIGGTIELKGELRANYIVKCYRCLEEVKFSIDTRIKEKFIRKSESEDADDYTFDGNFLDIDKALVDNIILNLPMKQLCSIDCKGLCLKCGANLNNDSCQCESDNTNIKMEVLRNFFNN